MPAYGQFGYDLGSLMQLTWNGPVWEITWRGWLLTKHPGGGNYRQAVYRAGPHWDAYFEDELRQAFQGKW